MGRSVDEQKSAIKSIIRELDALVSSSEGNKEKEKRVDLFLEWITAKIRYVSQENEFKPNTLPDFQRGDVVLVRFGFNIGSEFGGNHPAVILRHSRASNDRITVLPLTSKEPKNKDTKIYVEIGNVKGLNPEDYHWANILNVQSVSKQRIIYPPEAVRVDNRILNRISGAIQSQIALR